MHALQKNPVRNAELTTFSAFTPPSPPFMTWTELPLQECLIRARCYAVYSPSVYLRCTFCPSLPPCAPEDSSIQIQSPGIPGGCFLVGSMGQTRAWEERERALPRLAALRRVPVFSPTSVPAGQPSSMLPALTGFWQHSLFPLTLVMG